MEHGTLHFQDFDEFLNVDDFFPQIEKEYIAIDAELTDSDEMLNIRVRHFEVGMCLTFDFVRVRGIGMRKKNIVAIEAAIREYINAFPTQSNDMSDKPEATETEEEDVHPLVKIQQAADNAINNHNFQLADQMLDLYNKYRDTFSA